MLRIGTTRIAVGEQLSCANLSYVRIVCFISMEEPRARSSRIGDLVTRVHSVFLQWLPQIHCGSSMHRLLLS